MSRTNNDIKVALRKGKVHIQINDLRLGALKDMLIWLTRLPFLIGPNDCNVHYDDLLQSHLVEIAALIDRSGQERYTIIFSETQCLAFIAFFSGYGFDDENILGKISCLKIIEGIEKLINIPPYP